MGKNNGTYKIQNAIDTFPASVAQTGTITLSPNKLQIIGVGTTFGANLKAGDWIFIPSIQEVQRLDRVCSDTEIWVREPFEDTFTAAAFARVPSPSNMLISYLIEGGAVIVDKTIISENVTNGFENPEYQQAIDPIVFNAVNTPETKVTITWRKG